MNISVIIPVLNEEQYLARLLDRITFAQHPVPEIIVVDGGSTDQSVVIARQYQVTIIHAKVCRAVQLNAGAKAASGEVLFFVHADCLPPASFQQDISKARQLGYEIGSYRSCFDSSSLLLRINAWFTRFRFLWVRGGDQGIFITRSLYDQLGGFNEEYVIMEEYELLRRNTQPFFLFDASTLISARKYENRSWLKVQWANFMAFRQFSKGIPASQIREQYLQRLK